MKGLLVKGKKQLRYLSLCILSLQPYLMTLSPQTIESLNQQLVVARNEVQKLKTQNSFIISEEAQKQAGLEVDLMDAQEKVEKLTREKGINKE